MSMETSPPSVTYYEILQVKPHATPSEVRQAYLRLIKLSHPDKTPLSGLESSTVSAQRVIEAYAILSDQSTRVEYDKNLELEKPMTIHQQQCDIERPIVSQILDLSEFDQLPPDTHNMRENEMTDRFIYPCRCGGQFMITSQDMESNHDVVGCNGCSLTVKVEFEFE